MEGKEEEGVLSHVMHSTTEAGKGKGREVETKEGAFSAAGTNKVKRIGSYTASGFMYVHQ